MFMRAAETALGVSVIHGALHYPAAAVPRYGRSR